MPDTKNITLLCKVVDNFGDIGFVYRLARALSERDRTRCLRLVVSDLPSFAALAPAVDPRKPVQTCYGWQIFDWNAAAECARAFTREPPAIILECFQCGRPGWLDALLFDTARADDAHSADFVQILNIDYLTAEAYAEDFHLLKSGTRSARVKKTNFMPGFTAKTGGLILDDAFLRSRQRAKTPPADTTRDFTAVFFSYERDCAPLVQALAQFQAEDDIPVRVLVAPGKSSAPFMSAWERAGMPFAAQPLPFLPQEDWDALLCAADWNFVRGEDSLSRACLAGVPFIWQPYPQDDDYHLVKLAALNERLRPFFPPAAFTAYDVFARDYALGTESAEALLRVLSFLPQLRRGFAAFAERLLANGDLARHLLDWLDALHNP